jgi:hypothetical protein
MLWGKEDNISKQQSKSNGSKENTSDIMKSQLEITENLKDWKKYPRFS